MATSGSGTRLLCSSAAWGKGAHVCWKPDDASDVGGKMKVAEGGEEGRPTIFCEKWRGAKR